MRILVGCSLPESILQDLRSLSAHVVYEPDLTAEQLRKLISDTAILVVGRTRVSAEVINAGRALQMIIRAGTNTANIAVDDASAAGVFVCNCPDKDAIAVAELMLGQLIALDRRLIDNAAAFLAGELRTPTYHEAAGLAGRRLGLLGCGAVQRELAHRAATCGMRVAVWSPELPEEVGEQCHVEICNWPRELARTSDMVAVHAPRREPDEVLLDADFIDNMKKGAYLAFVGHPAAVDESALLRVARERELRVAFDICTTQVGGAESGRLKSHIRELPGVICTFGLGDRTRQAWEAVGDEVLRVIKGFLVGGEVLNCVNLLEHSPATWQLVLRLKDTVGVMASVMDHVRADGINAQEISARVFTGAKAAWCLIALDERPSVEALDAIRQLDGVLHLELRALV